MDKVRVVIPTAFKHENVSYAIHSFIDHNAPWIDSLEVVNRGTFAENCNYGAEKCRAPWLLFLNDDTYTRNSILKLMLDTAKQFDAQVVGAYLQFPDGSIQHYGVYYTDAGLPFHLFYKQYLESALHFGVKPRLEPHLVPSVTGACILIRTELFFDLGGFDTVFVNGFEDVDFNLKALNVGAKIALCTETSIVHYEKVSRGDPNKKNKMDNRFHENLKLLTNRWDRNKVRRLVKEYQPW